MQELIDRLTASHHIDAEGRFQSDKHPGILPDKIILSFKDGAARAALRYFALFTEDDELAGDILRRIRSIETPPR